MTSSGSHPRVPPEERGPEEPLVEGKRRVKQKGGALREEVPITAVQERPREMGKNSEGGNGGW